MKHLFFFSSFVLLVGCSSASETATPASAKEDAASVFDVPADGAADATEVTGVWETAEPTRVGTLESHLRFELRADHVIAAARCTIADGSVEPVVAAARVSGTVSADSIALAQKVDATKPIGSVGVCGVRVAQGALPRCADGTKADERKGCFAIEDGSLTLYQGSGPRAFVKIAD